MLLAACGAAGLAAVLNRFMQASFVTDSKLARSWLQVPFAFVLGGLAGLAGSVFEVVTFALLAVGASLLIVIDFAEYRLPDRIVFPMYGVLAVGLTIAAAMLGRWSDLGRAGIIAAIMLALYFVMAIFARDLGFGDVKLAGVVGGFLGWFGVAQSVAGFLLSWVMMAVVGIALIIAKRVDTKGSLPFGPYLIWGAVLGAFVGPLMFPVWA